MMFRQSSTRRSTTGRSAFSLFQRTRYLVAGSCHCCDAKPNHFCIYPLAFMQVSRAWLLVPASAKAASRSHSYKSRKRSLSLWFLVSLGPRDCRLAHPARIIAPTTNNRNFMDHSFAIESLLRLPVKIKDITEWSEHWSTPLGTLDANALVAEGVLVDLSLWGTSPS